MGCFIACFGSSKHRKSRRRLSPNPQPQPQIYKHIEPVARSVPSQPIDESEKQSIQNKFLFNSDVNTSKEEEKEVVEEEGQITKFSDKEESQTLSDSSVSSYISYPPMHRYHNCTITDEEFEDIDSKDDDHHALVVDEESLFSVSIGSRKQVNIIETEEVSSPLRILTPVEPRTSPPTLNHHHQEKENRNSEQELNCEEPSLTSSSPKQRFSNLRPRMEVDTSLSSWLVGSEKTPMSEDSLNSDGNLLLSRQTRRGNSSSTSFEERQILGELNVEEIKQLSAPRDEGGSIESYWNHTMDSCSTKLAEVDNSTPFATRLERTLDIEIA